LDLTRPVRPRSGRLLVELAPLLYGRPARPCTDGKPSRFAVVSLDDSLSNVPRIPIVAARRRC
jgi:hypothetical protein